MFSSMKLSTNRSSREMFKIFRRDISKTTTAPNSDAISRQENKQNNDHLEVTPSKWSRLTKHNNNRALSTLQTKAVPKQSHLNWASKEESREFMGIFPDIVRDLTDAGRHTDIPEITKRYAKLLQYNVPTGKKARGLALISSYKLIERPENLTNENIRLANILGWCMEMLQGFFVVMDDIMDQAEVRRGAKCWYKKDDVGLMAVNDGIMLENGMYSILRKYFAQHPAYVPIMEIFHDVTLKSVMGQSLDMLCSGSNGPNLDMFTMKRYSAMVKYRGAYYSFQLPVALAMYLANHQDPEMHRQAKTVLLEMGHFFQVQDDFLDCFGQDKEAKYVQDGKCTWLAVVALQRATQSQRKLMEEHYGKSDPASVEIIRNLYRELGLPNTFAIYEEESYNLIRTRIQQLTKGLPLNLFFKVMEKIYKREYNIL